MEVILARKVGFNEKKKKRTVKVNAPRMRKGGNDKSIWTENGFISGGWEYLVIKGRSMGQNIKQNVVMLDNSTRTISSKAQEMLKWSRRESLESAPSEGDHRRSS